MSLLAESILASLIDLVIRVQKLVLLELDDAPLCSILTDDRSGVKNGWFISSREMLSYVRDCILLVVVGGVKNSVFVISASTSFTTCLFLNYWAGFLAFIDNIIGINRKRWGLPCLSRFHKGINFTTIKCGLSLKASSRQVIRFWCCQYIYYVTA